MKNNTIVLYLLICLSCGCATTYRGATFNTLNATVIPELDFRQAHIRDAVTWLNHQMVSGQKPAPTVVLLLRERHTTELVTLQARNITVWQAVTAIAKLTDSEIQVEENTVFLEPRSPRLETFEGEMITEGDPFE